MTDENQEIWSNTLMPYECLKDAIRTRAFEKAIKQVVRPGDIVLDVGAGSGILSFFAAAAGAKKVYSVEIDPELGEALCKSKALNGFDSVIEVVRSNVLTASLPEQVDVLIAEIIDTGLMDELQVPVINDLRRRNIIGPKTQLVPLRYQTDFQLIYSDNNYYGFQIVVPKHEWPHYQIPNCGWWMTQIEPVSEAVTVASLDFSNGPLEEEVDRTVTFHLSGNRPATGVRISGRVELCEGLHLQPTNALNGDKILPIDPIENAREVTLRIRYRHGGGMKSFHLERL